MTLIETPDGRRGKIIGYSVAADKHSTEHWVLVELYPTRDQPPILDSFELQHLKIPHIPDPPPVTRN